jgi:2-polyprenyl-6-methoxyphenol hydroxylase-like FAD-dependent oxidoreductase
MYDRLPNKRKVLERARVERVITENSTIRLVLADGREFSGDLLVGADGVHPKVRELIWDNATRIALSMIPYTEKQGRVYTLRPLSAFLISFYSHENNIWCNRRPQHANVGSRDVRSSSEHLP